MKLISLLSHDGSIVGAQLEGLAVGTRVYVPIESVEYLTDTPRNQWGDVRVEDSSTVTLTADNSTPEVRLAVLSPEQAVLAVMVPGIWYTNPRRLKAAAGVTDSGLLSRMCEQGLLLHGNGITTSGFCKPA